MMSSPASQLPSQYAAMLHSNSMSNRAGSLWKDALRVRMASMLQHLDSHPRYEAASVLGNLMERLESRLEAWASRKDSVSAAQVALDALLLEATRELDERLTARGVDAAIRAELSKPFAAALQASLKCLDSSC